MEKHTAQISFLNFILKFENYKRILGVSLGTWKSGIKILYLKPRASLVAQMVKNLPAIQETQV